MKKIVKKVNKELAARMKKLIFISHASREDNYIASWLAAKLQLLGYDTWVDIEDLRTGDSFWPEIENKIKNESIKFIMVITSNYLSKARTPQTGVRKEIACASNVRDIKRFLYPIRFDESDFSDFPIDVIELNANDFFKNWGVGLKKLLAEFDKDGVEKSKNISNPVSLWFQSQKLDNSVIEREEKYFSNWIRIELPEKIHIHFPKSFKEEFLRELPLTFIRHGNSIISFSDVDKLDDKFLSSYEFDTNLFTSNEEIKLEDSYSIQEPNKRLIWLLNKSFKSFLINRGLKKYQLSSNKEAFYFPYNDINKKQVSLKNLNRSRKALVGIQNGAIWQYGVSQKADLQPFPHFKIFPHIIFSDLKYTLLDKVQQHAFRRSVPSDWFNRDWLDLLMAFFTRLNNNEDNYISLKKETGGDIRIASIPEVYSSGFGYREKE